MGILAECPSCHKKQSAKNKLCGCGQDLVKSKRSNTVKYWVNYGIPGTKKQRRECVGTSIEEARAADGKRRAQRYENPRILQKVPEQRMSFQQLTDWYLGLEKVKARAYFPTLKINLASFNEVFGNYIVSNIKPADLENYQARRKAEGYSDAYIDQQIGAARNVTNKAFDNDFVTGETVKAFKKVKKLLKRNGNARDRILSMDEVNALLDALPRHTKAILATGFYTGMRKGEIVNLTWDKVDMEQRFICLVASDTKDHESREIPIGNELYQIFRAVPRALHDRHVFLFKGKPVSDIRSGLTKACKEAGIEYGRFVKGGFVFHDLRHTFNTYMRKAGVAQSVIMKITGHSTEEMFRRYDSIDHEDAHNAVDQMRNYLQSIDQNVDQGAKSD
jgi:integrase